MDKRAGGRDGAAASAQPSQELVALLRAGDIAAFDQFYAAHHNRLYAFLLRLTRDEGLACDLAQDTWLRLAANARRLAADSNPAAWLFAVARNLYRSHRRWALLDRARLLELAGFQSPKMPSPLERLRHDRTQRAVEHGIASLPLAEREVLLLVCVEGIGANEVAAMLGLSPEATRKRLSRARAKLLAALPEAAFEEEAP
jgi:RNA polymerase sigma-70 factor (ECF subfamily)